MGEWLKSKYKELLINGLISALCVFLGFWAYGYRDSKQGVSKDILQLQINKADKTVVDKRFNEHLTVFEESQNKEIDSKADKSMVESMDKKLDLILMKLN